MGKILVDLSQSVPAEQVSRGKQLPVSCTALRIVHRASWAWGSLETPEEPQECLEYPARGQDTVLQGGNAETLGPGAVFSPANRQCHSRGHLATASKVRGIAGLVLPPPTPLISNKSPAWVGWQTWEVWYS